LPQVMGVYRNAGMVQPHKKGVMVKTGKANVFVGNENCGLARVGRKRQQKRERRRDTLVRHEKARKLQKDGRAALWERRRRRRMSGPVT